MSGKGSKASSRAGSKAGSKPGSKTVTPRSSKASTPKGSKSNTPLPVDSVSGAVNGSQDLDAGATDGALEPMEAGEAANGRLVAVDDNGELAVSLHEAETNQRSVVEMIKERISICNWKEDWWTETHDASLQKFIEDPGTRFLVAYHDQLRGFCLEHSLPAFSVEQLTYFIKTGSVKELNSDNLLKNVHYGTVKGAHIESLLRLMMGIYAPIFFENTSWPDNAVNPLAAP